MTGFIRRLVRDSGAVALVEFAYAMPVLFGFGLYGVEVANLAVASSRISQVALSLADNGSRVGENTPLAIKQLREADIVDIFQGARLQAGNYDLGGQGRVTLSSLQRNANGGQWIFWQRCMGQRQGADFASHYGIQNDGSTGRGLSTDTFRGMGKPGALITAPEGGAVIFVEVNYDWTPALAGWLVPARRLHATAAFIVRDRRDLTTVHNPQPQVTPMTCDLFAS